MAELEVLGSARALAVGKFLSTGRPSRTTAVGLVWREGEPLVGTGRWGGVQVQQATVVQLLEALAQADFPEGTVRFAPAMLPTRAYPIERLALLEERTAAFLTTAAVTPPALPRRQADREAAFLHVQRWAVKELLPRCVVLLGMEAAGGGS